MSSEVGFGYPYSRSTVARVCGTLLLACGAFALLPAALGRLHDGGDLARTAVVATIGCALGALGLVAPRRMPVAALRAVPALATLLVCAPSYLTGLAPNGTEPLLIWGVMVSAAFGSRLDGWLGAGFAAAAYAPLAVVTDHHSGVEHALYLVGATAVTVLVMSSLRDRLAHQLSAAREVVRRDDLTGLLNQRAFDALFAHEAARCERAGSPLALLLLEVDRPADDGDGGHRARPQLLHDVAEVLRSQRRDSDVLAHLGDDRFAILLPACGADNAARRAEHIRSLVERTAAGWPRPITVSIGVACMPTHVCRAAELRATARAALASARADGRNRVIIAPDTGGSPRAE